MSRFVVINGRNVYHYSKQLANRPDARVVDGNSVKEVYDRVRASARTAIPEEAEAQPASYRRELEDMTRAELEEFAGQVGVDDPAGYRNKAELLEAIKETARKPRMIVADDETELDNLGSLGR